MIFPSGHLFRCSVTSLPKLEAAPRQVLLAQLTSQPAPAFLFADCAGRVAAGERVENQVAGRSQELHKKPRQGRREARRVRLDAGGLARFQVRAIAVVIAADQQVGRDGAAMVFIELGRDVVAGGALLRAISSTQPLEAGFSMNAMRR